MKELYINRCFFYEKGEVIDCEPKAKFTYFFIKIARCIKNLISKNSISNFLLLQQP
jgi:hypothetical protein